LRTNSWFLPFVDCAWAALRPVRDAEDKPARRIVLDAA
jgi:hypothetical protein